MNMDMHYLNCSKNLQAQRSSASGFSCVKFSDTKAHTALTVCAFLFAGALLSISISAAIIMSIIIFAIIIIGNQRTLRKQKNVFDF